MTYIGLDNGVSGSIGVIDVDTFYIKTPIRNCLNYTKAKQFVNRIDSTALYDFLTPFSVNAFCMIERPMINPGRWNASMSAIRAMEATMVILERLAIPYQFIDSKEWQRALLPQRILRKKFGKNVTPKEKKRIKERERAELKFASLDVARRLFPSVDLTGFQDGDGLLLAEYCRRTKKI